MNFFDLHCHPGLKTLFQMQDGGQFSVWQTLNPADLFGDILSSQCSLKQLTLNGDINLVCITLHAPESGMINQFLIRLSAAIFFKNYLNKDRLQMMYSGEEGYNTVFAEELRNLQEGPRPDDRIPPAKHIVFLKNWSDYEPNAKDTLHVMFNIEGGHNLYDDRNKFLDIDKVLNNLQEFLDKGFLTLYLTPTHLTPNAFVNHAYGNKILTRGPLLPTGLGVTAEGRKLIDYAYHYNLLVDVKHMSLVSRLMFYKYHERFFPNKPIIASHVGLTGLSASQYLGDWSRDHHIIGNVVEVNSYKPQGLIAGTSFYPLSINLFNEDIIAILKSGGLIGLSMDVRIIGGKETADDLQHDFLSFKEYKILSSKDYDTQISLLVERLLTNTIPATQDMDFLPDSTEFKKVVEDELAEIMPLSVPNATDRPRFVLHGKYLANQLLKLLQITNMYGMTNPWKQICIGSDFDGLIEAVDCCKNATEFKLMASILEHELAAGATEARLDLQIPAAQIVEQYCFSNAAEFIKTHFN